MQTTLCAADFALERAGNKMAAKMPRMAMTTSNSTNVNACLPKSVKRPIGSTGRVINRNSITIAVAIVCPSHHQAKSAVAIQNNINRNAHIRKFIPTTINKDNTTRQIWEFAKLLFFSCNVEINGMPDSPDKEEAAHHHSPEYPSYP